RGAAHRPHQGDRAAVAVRAGRVALRQPALPDGVALNACAPEVQLAVAVGALPLKNSIVVAPEQLPSLSSSLPLRYTTVDGAAYGTDADGRLERTYWRAATKEGSAFRMKAFQISAGNVPPSTVWPWYSV